MALGGLQREYPRDGSENGEILASGMDHVPCVLLVDQSGSMEDVKAQLDQAMQNFRDALLEDSMTKLKVEICVITFDDHAHIVTPFVSAMQFETPRIATGGLTAMHEAVDAALEQIQIRKDQYRAQGTSFYRPWIFLLTDGGSNDRDNGAFERLVDAQRGKHCTFFPVALISDDFPQVERDNLMNTLYQLRPDHRTFVADKENIASCFEFLSNSLAATSNSNRDEKVTLDVPEEMTFQQITVDA